MSAKAPSSRKIRREMRKQLKGARRTATRGASHPRKPGPLARLRGRRQYRAEIRNQRRQIVRTSRTEAIRGRREVRRQTRRARSLRGSPFGRRDVALGSLAAVVVLAGAGAIFVIGGRNDTTALAAFSPSTSPAPTVAPSPSPSPSPKPASKPKPKPKQRPKPKASGGGASGGTPAGTTGGGGGGSAPPPQPTPAPTKPGPSK